MKHKVTYLDLLKKHVGNKIFQNKEPLSLLEKLSIIDHYSNNEYILHHLYKYKHEIVIKLGNALHALIDDVFINLGGVYGVSLQKLDNIIMTGKKTESGKEQYKEIDSLFIYNDIINNDDIIYASEIKTNPDLDVDKNKTISDRFETLYKLLLAKYPGKTINMVYLFLFEDSVNLKKVSSIKNLLNSKDIPIEVMSLTSFLKKIFSDDSINEIELLSLIKEHLISVIDAEFNTHNV